MPKVVNKVVKLINMEWLKVRRKYLRLSQDDLARELQLAGFDIVRSSVSHMDVLTVLERSGFAVRTQHDELAERAAWLIDSMPEEKQRLALRLIESLLDDNGVGV